MPSPLLITFITLFLELRVVHLPTCSIFTHYFILDPGRPYADLVTLAWHQSGPPICFSGSSRPPLPNLLFPTLISAQSFLAKPSEALKSTDLNASPACPDPNLLLSWRRKPASPATTPQLKPAAYLPATCLKRYLRSPKLPRKSTCENVGGRTGCYGLGVEVVWNPLSPSRYVCAGPKDCSSLVLGKPDLPLFHSRGI